MLFMGCVSTLGRQTQNFSQRFASRCKCDPSGAIIARESVFVGSTRTNEDPFSFVVVDGATRAGLPYCGGRRWKIAVFAAKPVHRETVAQHRMFHAIESRKGGSDSVFESKQNPSSEFSKYNLSHVRPCIASQHTAVEGPSLAPKRSARVGCKTARSMPRVIRSSRGSPNVPVLFCYASLSQQAT